MYRVMRIIFCIVAVLLAAAAIFVFVYAGWVWGIIVVLGAAVCGALMVTFKNLQDKQERAENPPPKQGDFINGNFFHKLSISTC